MLRNYLPRKYNQGFYLQVDILCIRARMVNPSLVTLGLSLKGLARVIIFFVQQFNQQL